MEMESSLAMPPAIATPSHAEFTPNRPHSSYAIAFRFTLNARFVLKLGNNGIRKASSLGMSGKRVTP